MEEKMQKRDKMIGKLMNKRNWALLGCVLVIGMLYLRDFIREVSYTSSPKYHVILCFVVVGFMGFLIPTILDGIFDEEKGVPARTGSFHYTVIALFVLLISANLWMLGENLFDISIFDRNVLRLGDFSVHKTELYDLWAVLLFPIWTECVFAVMKRSGFTRGSVTAGIFQMMAATGFGYLFFRPLTNVWLVDLALMNVAAVAFALYKYIWRENPEKRYLAAGALGAYGGIWLFLLWLIRRSFESFSSYMYMDGSEWETYVSKVKLLLNGSVGWGPSWKLLNNKGMHEFLLNNDSYVQQLLYYGGGIAAGLLLVGMILFLTACWKMAWLNKLGSENYCSVNLMIFLVFAIRVVMGLLYELALFPYPIHLPFEGEGNMIIDGILFTTLLYMAMNHDIECTYELKEEFGEASEDECDDEEPEENRSAKQKLSLWKVDLDDVYDDLDEDMEEEYEECEEGSWWDRVISFLDKMKELLMEMEDFDDDDYDDE